MTRWKRMSCSRTLGRRKHPIETLTTLLAGERTSVLGWARWRTTVHRFKVWLVAQRARFA
jgi:hypothetical protein